MSVVSAYAAANQKAMAAQAAGGGGDGTLGASGDPE